LTRQALKLIDKSNEEIRIIIVDFLIALHATIKAAFYASSLTGKTIFIVKI